MSDSAVLSVLGEDSPLHWRTAAKEHINHSLKCCCLIIVPKNCVSWHTIVLGDKGADHMAINLVSVHWMPLKNISHLFLCFCMFLLHRTDETFPAYCCKTVCKDWQSSCLVSHIFHSFVFLCFKLWFHIKRSLATILAYKAHTWLLTCHCKSQHCGFPEVSGTH